VLPGFRPDVRIAQSEIGAPLGAERVESASVAKPGVPGKQASEEADPWRSAPLGRAAVREIDADDGHGALLCI
jgi:hypothetical protein